MLMGSPPATSTAGRQSDSATPVHLLTLLRGAGPTRGGGTTHVHNKRREGWSITPILTLGFSGHAAAHSADNRGLRDNSSWRSSARATLDGRLGLGLSEGNSLVWGNPCRRYGV